jgi:hypothetical protein
MITSENMPILTLKKFVQNRNLIFVLKLLVSVGIILFLFQRIDLKYLTAKLLSMQWSYLIVCLSLFFLGEILHALRWKILLKCKKIEVSTVKLLYFNFVGLFFNLFFPTAIGGDVIRIYQMSTHSQNTSEAVASVLLDRGVGFFTLLCVAPIMVIFSTKQMETFAFFSPIILLSFTAMAAIFIFFRLKEPMQKWPSANKNKFYKRIMHYYDVLDAYRSHKKIILLAMVISLGMIFLGIFITYLISHGLGLDIPLAYFNIFVPIIFLITMIPISIHGLGLREGAFVFFFAKAGLSVPEALSISLISYVLTLIFGMIGGMGYIVHRDQWPGVRGNM